MSHNEQDDPLNQQYRRVLDKQIETLDGKTLSRLQRARTQALQPIQQKTPARFHMSLGWTAGFAAVVVLSVTLALLSSGERNYSQDFVAGLADAELLADDESIEFYEELDFYIWLEQQNSNPGEV